MMKHTTHRDEREETRLDESDRSSKRVSVAVPREAPEREMYENVPCTD